MYVWFEKLTERWLFGIEEMADVRYRIEVRQKIIQLSYGWGSGWYVRLPIHTSGEGSIICYSYEFKRNVHSDSGKILSTWKILVLKTFMGSSHKALWYCGIVFTVQGITLPMIFQAFKPYCSLSRSVISYSNVINCTKIQAKWERFTSNFRSTPSTVEAMHRSTEICET